MEPTTRWVACPAMATGERLVPIFDLDGTLLDTDEALAAAFVALGVPREDVTWGHVLEQECRRLGIELDAYLDAYDAELSQPFAGAAELVEALERWAVCSNKHPLSGHAELGRLGWEPEVALFADTFDGPKRLGPVLERMGLRADEVVFIGDTGHDRVCAREVGARFVLAGWNPRAEAAPGDLVADHPAEVVAFLEAELSRPAQAL